MPPCSCLTLLCNPRRIEQFAELYAVKLGCKAATLQRALWGEYAYQPKSKRIVRIRGEQQGRLRPLFVQLALEPLWKVRARGCLIDIALVAGMVVPWAQAKQKICGAGAAVEGN